MIDKNEQIRIHRYLKDLANRRLDELGYLSVNSIRELFKYVENPKEWDDSGRISLAIKLGYKIERIDDNGRQ